MIKDLKKKKPDQAEKPEAIQKLKSFMDSQAVADPELEIELEWIEPPKPEDKPLEWQKKEYKVKTTVVKCIVIDRYNRWHEGIPVELNGRDTTGYSWGYYGENYPVLVETDTGKLKPWHLHDTVGESSNRLYKASNPEGFRNTFKHRSSILQKIQVGLMVALVLGLFFLMFVMISS